MLGAFQYFFYQQHVLAASVLTIWIHGTLEISAIVLAGGAGFVMARGLLFPGTYSRAESFRHAAREGVQAGAGAGAHFHPGRLPGKLRDAPHRNAGGGQPGHYRRLGGVYWVVFRVVPHAGCGGQGVAAGPSQARS